MTPSTPTDAAPPIASAARAPHPTGSTRVATARRRRSPLGWLPWALGALLLALLLLTAIAFVTVDAPGSADTADTADTADRSSSTAQGSGTDGGGTGAEGAGSGGTLTSGSTNVLADPAAIASLNGKPVQARGVVVHSVVSDEGFWVGPSAADRVFVYLEPGARRSSGESPFQVKAGQRITFTGTVRPVPAGAADALRGVSDAEGADQLTRQRAYIDVTEPPRLDR